MAVAALLAAGMPAAGQEQANPIARITGQWDLVGTLISVEVKTDGSVFHSKYGLGYAKHEFDDYFQIEYTHHFMVCRYRIRRYSADEVSFTIANQTDPQQCDLGTSLKLRPPPTTKRDFGVVNSPPDPTKAKNEPTDGSTAGGPKSNSGGAGVTPTQPDTRSSSSARPVPFVPFRDCADCPEMVSIPAGQFLMGSPDTEPGRSNAEGPIHPVSLKPFVVGRTPVTIEEYQSFVLAMNRKASNACTVFEQGRWVAKAGLSHLSPGFQQTPKHPVVCVTFQDAKDYAAWLSIKTGKHYRLLSESEREYVARGGSSTPFTWGSTIDPSKARYDPDDPSMVKPNGTGVVTQFQANGFNVLATSGNVSEWVEDCWSPSYSGRDGTGTPNFQGDCSRRVVRGGSWGHSGRGLRSAAREAAQTAVAYWHVGFRVARDQEQD